MINKLSSEALQQKDEILSVDGLKVDHTICKLQNPNFRIKLLVLPAPPKAPTTHTYTPHHNKESLLTAAAED